MSGDDKSESGITRTLKKMFGKTPASDEEPGAEVVLFQADSSEASEPNETDLFHVDPEWRRVDGAWVGCRNAFSVDPEDVRTQTMTEISQMRSKLYERVGERSMGLPDFPETPARLDQLMNEEEPNSLQVMRCIEADPKLVGRVWKRARSARFPSSPSSLDMAVSRIGLVEVWRLSLESALDAVEFRAGPFKDHPSWRVFYTPLGSWCFCNWRAKPLRRWPQSNESFSFITPTYLFLLPTPGNWTLRFCPRSRFTMLRRL